MPATVTVAPIQLEDNLGKFKDAGDGAASVFPDYQIFNRYEKDHHLHMMGVTSPNGFQGSSASFVQLAAPTLVWIVDWTACRAGAKPVAPNPASKNANWILLGEVWEPSMMSVMPDGVTTIYRLSGTFFYGCRNPKAQTNQDVTFPRAPWLQDTFDRSVPDSSLETGLFDSAKETIGNFVRVR